ncbi:MAG TPA: DUF502 domain-containing protein [Syntrophomonadaceae bacterium]|nr:DUF502 domain-containing protein [Syntrophomonadaceae bacterium]
MKRLTRYFLNGLLFMVPFMLTLYIFFQVFTRIDHILKIPIPGIGIIPGVGFITTLLIITLVGFLVSNFLTRKIFYWFDGIMNRLPLVKLVYSSVKDLIGAFLGDKKTFNRPVLVRLSQETEAHALGFVTCDSLDNFGLDDYIAVYLPQSYNFAGNLLVFPRDQVRALETNSSELMTFIVSGGVASAGNGDR